MPTYETVGRFSQPSSGELAGTMVVERSPAPYQRYMTEQGIPVTTRMADQFADAPTPAGRAGQ